MATSENQTANISDTKTRQKKNPKPSSSPIRVKQRTKAKLGQLLRQVNKGRVGRKIKPDDLLWFSLGLLTDEHLGEICNHSLSNKDRMELLFRKVSKERKGTTRDEFFGMLLEGKLPLQ